MSSEGQTVGCDGEKKLKAKGEYRAEEEVLERIKGEGGDYKKKQVVGGPQGANRKNDEGFCNDNHVSL